MTRSRRWDKASNIGAKVLMEVTELCRDIGKAICLPPGLHVALVFRDNSHDEVIGWRVLDTDNSPVSAIFSFDELKDLKQFL